MNQAPMILRSFFDLGTGRVVFGEVVYLDNPRRSSIYGFMSFKSIKNKEKSLKMKSENKNDFNHL